MKVFTKDLQWPARGPRNKLIHSGKDRGIVSDQSFGTTKFSFGTLLKPELQELHSVVSVVWRIILHVLQKFFSSPPKPQVLFVNNGLGPCVRAQENKSIVFEMAGSESILAN